MGETEHTITGVNTQWQRLRQRLPEQGVITSIDVPKNDPNLRRVRVDARIAARLTADEVERLGLTVHMTWDAALADRVAEYLAFRRALSQRGFSVQAMCERLMRRGYAESTAQSVADTLQRDGWLDDERLARDLVDSLCREKPAGKALIIEKLTKRGIATDLAHRVADERHESQNEDDAAMAFAKKRLAKMPNNVDKTTKARRLAGALARRGFEQDVVEDIVRKLDLDGENDTC